jgi:hypothetical protein
MRPFIALLLVTALANIAQGVSLTGYYKLDDATATTAAATIGANGTYVGSFAPADLGQAGSPGDPGGSSVRYVNSGTLDRRILVPARGGTPSGTNLSITMWVQFDASALTRDTTLANNDTIFGASNLNVFRDEVNAANAANTDLIAALMGGDPRANSATGSANNLAWHLIAATYDTSNAGADADKVYIDGVRSIFGATATDLDPISTNEIALGNIRGAAGVAHANQFSGLLDEVGFWDRQLNTAEMRALFFLADDPNTGANDFVTDTGGAATLFDFFEDGSNGDTLLFENFLFTKVADVTAFGGIAGQSVQLGNDLILGLAASGNGGLFGTLAVPEPATHLVWLVLGAMGLVAARCRRARR